MKMLIAGDDDKKPVPSPQPPPEDIDHRKSQKPPLPKR